MSQPANETREWHNGPEIENGRRIHDKQIVTGEKKNLGGNEEAGTPPAATVGKLVGQKTRMVGQNFIGY